MAQDKGNNQGQMLSVQEKATSEEQDAYKKTVLAGTQAIYADQTHPQVMQMLQQGAETPAQTLAATAVMIITKLDEQSGNQIPEVVVIPAGHELLAELARLATESGAFDGQAVRDQATQEYMVQIAQQYEIAPEEVASLLEGVKPEEAQMLVKEQSQIAGSAGGAPQTAPGAAQGMPATPGPGGPMV